MKPDVKTEVREEYTYNYESGSVNVVVVNGYLDEATFISTISISKSFVLDLSDKGVQLALMTINEMIQSGKAVMSST